MIVIIILNDSCSALKKKKKSYIFEENLVKSIFVKCFFKLYLDYSNHRKVIRGVYKEVYKRFFWSMLLMSPIFFFLFLFPFFFTITLLLERLNDTLMFSNL